MRHSGAPVWHSYHTTRQGLTRQGVERQGTARHCYYTTRHTKYTRRKGRTRQGKTRHYTAFTQHGKARQGTTRQGTTRRDTVQEHEDESIPQQQHMVYEFMLNFLLIPFEDREVCTYTPHTTLFKRRRQCTCKVDNRNVTGMIWTST